MLDRVDDPRGDELRARDEPLEPVLDAVALREAGRLDEARVDRVHRDPPAGQLDCDRAGERELGVLRGRVGPDRDEPGDRDDVDDVRALPEPGQEGAQAPDRPEVVRPDHRLDQLRRRGQVGVAAGDPGVVDEQVDARVPLEHARRGRLDRRPVADIAGLVLVGVGRVAAREPDDVPAVRREAHGRAPRRSRTTLL